MTTKLENLRSLEELLDHARERGDEVEILTADDGSVYVASVDSVDRHGRRQISYLASTHWGSGGALELVHERGREPSLRWSSGGICSDATAMNVAYVMQIVWRDAAKKIALMTPNR